MVKTWKVTALARQTIAYDEKRRACATITSTLINPSAEERFSKITTESTYTKGIGLLEQRAFDGNGKMVRHTRLVIPTKGSQMRKPDKMMFE